MVHQRNSCSKELVNVILQDYIDKIFAFALKRTMNREDAEDLTQDIVFEVLRSSETLKEPKAFHGWLWAIAKNTWKRWVYKKHKQPLEYFDGLNIVVFDDGMSIEDILIDKEDVNLLRREIALLSQIQRDVTVLYYIEEKSCDEIADTLNISKGMVKQHLYKARNTIKEGIVMVREVGEKSYNPKDLTFSFIGEYSPLYIKMFERKLPKNIVMAAYERPITIEEISIETGVPRPYLEDELKILLDGDMLIQNKNGSYQTNFIIAEKELYTKIDKILNGNCEAFADKLLQSFNKSEKEIRDTQFVGSDFKWEKLLWTFLPLSMYLALCKIQAETLQQPPLLKTGIRGWANGWERKPHPWDFAVNASDLKSDIAYWTFNFGVFEEASSDTFGPNNSELALLKTIYAGGRDISEFNEKELEIAATLIRQGYLKKENERIILNAIGLDNNAISKLIDLESRERVFVYSELKQMLATLVNAIEAIVPKHLRNMVIAHAYISLIYIIPYVMRNLVERGILNIPEADERNTTAFCLIKDWSGIGIIFS